MELQLQRFDIKKSDYSALSPEELHFFLLITGITNEIAFLTKLSVYSLLSLPREPDLEGNSLSMLMLFLHKLLAAKLFEAHELLKVRYFGAKISVHYKDNNDLTAIVREINSYFGKENAIEKLRHNFSSHHYDNDRLLVDAFNGLSDDYNLSHYTTGQIANTIHYGTQEIEITAMLKLFGITADIESRNKAFLMFRDEVLDMAQLFGKFVETYMNACFQKNFKKEKDGKTTNCVKYSKVRINATAVKDIRISFFSYVDPKEFEELASGNT